MPLKANERHAITFLLHHMAGGIAGAVMFGLVVLYVDVGGLWTMARTDPQGWLFVAILFFGLFVTCGSVAMGIGIMSLTRDTDSLSE
jgi:hypothetical protein